MSKGLKRLNDSSESGSFMTGVISMMGRDGITVTHNRGSINYLVKIMPTGTDGSRVGSITYIKSNNTVTIYNTGEGDVYHAPILADIELSAL